VTRKSTPDRGYTVVSVKLRRGLSIQVCDGEKKVSVTIFEEIASEQKKHKPISGYRFDKTAKRGEIIDVEV
jgi:hypothetical protein